MNEPLAFLNGRFLPFREAALPLHDAGLVSGATVVDNARTFGGKLFRWADHLARFRRDCASCIVPLTTSDAELTAIAERLVRENANGRELHVVTFATPGSLGFYLEEPNGASTLGVVTYPLPLARYRPLFTDGAVLASVDGIGTSPDAVVPPTVKHRSRMPWHVADHLARQRSGVPHAVAVGVEPDTLTETSIANLLAVIDGAVVSPPRGRILDGISLQVTRELCASRGLPFREGPIRPSDAISELLLTGTGFGIAGVRRLDDRTFDWPGPVLQKLLVAWCETTGTDLVAQFA